MPSSFRLAVLVGAAIAVAGVARGASQVPRYAFERGKVLTFHEDFSAQYHRADRHSVIDTKLDLMAHVVRKNGDGSYRLVFHMTDTTIRHLAQQTSEDRSDDLFYADVFPDGRERKMDWEKYQFVPGLVFPPLPKGEKEMDAGWKGAAQETTFDCKPVKGSTGFEFAATLANPVVSAIGDTHAVKCTFDRETGFVGRIEDSMRRDGKIKGQGGATIRLLGVTSMSAEDLRTYAADSDRYFAAANAYMAAMEKAGIAPLQDVATITDTALTDLKAALSAISVGEFKAHGDRHVQEHAGWVKDLLHASEGRAARIGKPAPDFETTDVDGNKVRLADLRGKVVVLDFWYRGCVWCARIVPLLNQLAKDFEGEPVAIRGMSIDPDVTDARYVIKQLGIKYPTLRAEGIDKRFGVTAFPTLIVIDKNGIVRQIEVGYSATTQHDVGKVIEGLVK